MNSNHLLESKRQFFYDNEGTEESRGDKIRLRGNKRTTTESLKTSSNISSHADMTQSDPFTDYPNVVQQTFSALQSLNTTLITNLVPEIIAQFETRQYFDSFTSMNGVELLSSLLSSVESTELKILFLRIIDGIAQMDEDDVLVTINAHLAPQLVHLCSILSPEILSLVSLIHSSHCHQVSLNFRTITR
ncbi:hypothetical protein BLNAU_13220 [Blattamonas nauphoetae]|uniref:Uncharacterized protein n=1 Tax=Blattamonas nauphoetae TaxID=2049346 RepID=A0ABQ9XNZ1_9EUKA|nr:hypothetical protein BLNAU_13220 [Blattamonas nauphoetae]